MKDSKNYTVNVGEALKYYMALEVYKEWLESGSQKEFYDWLEGQQTVIIELLWRDKEDDR